MVFCVYWCTVNKQTNCVATWCGRQYRPMPSAITKLLRPL